MQLVSTETVVDRGDEFDQTKLHIVPAAQAESQGVDALFASGRPISPSILEHRIQMLEKELWAEKIAHNATACLLSSANMRIAQFEHLAAGMAQALDHHEGHLMELARSPIDYAADRAAAVRPSLENETAPESAEPTLRPAA